MPDETVESQGRPARRPSSTTIDMDQILEFIRLGNERRSDEITLMAERLAQTVAEQLGQSGRGERLDEGRIRAYDVTRRQLAGPSDDEADTLGIGTIVSVSPHVVRVGLPCLVLLRNTGRAVQAAFAGRDGTVTTNVGDPRRDEGAGVAARSYELVTVTVPEGALTGPITIITDTGDITSSFDVPVAEAGAAAKLLADHVFMAVTQPGRGER